LEMAEVEEEQRAREEPEPMLKAEEEASDGEWRCRVCPGDSAFSLLAASFWVFFPACPLRSRAPCAPGPGGVW